MMASGDREKVLGIIKANAMHAFLATCDGDQPRVRSISPIVEDDFSIWVATSSKSRKVDQIKTNPKICLEFVQQPRGDRVATVIGKAVIMQDRGAKERIWKAASYDLGQFFPEGPGSADYCLLKIEIAKIEWWEGWEGGLHVFEPGRE